MIKRLWDKVMSTSRINPEEYAAKVSTNRFNSLGYALAGWVYMMRRQKNTRIMTVASVGVLAVALWLGVPPVEWAILILTITIVWLTEFLNAGIEAAVDLASPELHPMAKVGKDVASAAVLLGVIASMIIAGLLLLPKILLKLGM